MMHRVRCGRCGVDNRAEAGFCQACGEPLHIRACPACGGSVRAGARFCDSCGAPLAPETARGRRSVDELVAAPAAERRLVTVLFADAQGSTALTEQLGDEAMYGVLQECAARKQRAVDAHDGTVVQFRGDGIMALFGAPVAVEDAAVQAVLAALDMQSSLAAYREELAASAGPGCAFRMGVNTGPVVVGRIGEETLVDYTAIGDTANVAARLEQAADPGEVWLSQATWRSVRDFVACEEVGPLELKGKGTAVCAYRARHRSAVRTRLEAAVERGLSPFVGRDDELALLEGFMAGLHDRRGRVVAIVGDAGIGKSRLLRELRERAPDGVDWFEGRSSSADRRAPWHLVTDLLRRAFGVGEQHTHDDVAELVADRAAAWSPTAQQAVPYVEWLLGVPAPALADLDPRERRAGTFEALVTVVRDAAGRRPLVIALEDLHWADEASEAAIAALANAVADVPVLLLVTYRPDAPPELGDRSWFTRLALDGLGRDAAAALAAASVGAGLGDAARDLIVERSDGNPLFVEELTASLVEEGAVALRDGTIDLSGHPGELDVPASLQDVVLARISRLEREAREALQLASVIGREFTRRILDRIAGMPGRLDAHLADLESLELIRQHSWFPELAYLFKHAVVHDVTYSTLLEERRRALHRVVALATEELYADALGEHCESLARHWLAAGDEERALPHLIEAAQRALAGYSMARALEASEQAARIAEELGQLDTAIDLRVNRLDSLLATNDLDGVAVEVAQVARVAAAAGDAAGHAAALARRAFTEYLRHDFDTAVATAGRAVDLARQAHPDQRSIDALLFSAWVITAEHVVHGRLDEARREAAAVATEVSQATPALQAMTLMLSDAMANWQGDWRRPPTALALVPAVQLLDRIQLLWAMGLYAAGAGHYRAALDRLHEAVALCRRAGDLLVRARALNTIGWVHGDLGDTDGAARWNDEAVEVAKPLGLPDRELEANARLNLADDALMVGRVDDAARQLVNLERTVRAPTPAEEWMLWRYSQRWLCISGELALACGDAETALDFAEECLPRSEETESRKYIVRARRLRARALAALGRREEAGADLRIALELAREIGNPPQLWRTLTAAAELREGDRRRLAAEALDVIDGVAEGLGDHPLARSLAASPDRARAAALAGR
jgi:class 3 adenylate cyclase/tetratricopeptide (TPR) repeat protein